MLIKALSDYYDKLPEEEKQLTRTYINVSYAIDLSADGDIARIRSVKESCELTDKKGNTKIVYRPQRLMFTKRGGTTFICAYIVDHRPSYIFGVENEKGELKITPKSTASHKSFVDTNAQFFEKLTSPICRAFYAFVKKWTPDIQSVISVLKDIDADDLYKSGIAFCLDGHPNDYLNVCEEVLGAFDGMQTSDGQAITAQCSVSGELDAIAVLHDSVKGILGAQPSGCKLVCVNNTAEESYGHTQGGVGKVSKTVMERYTKALNYLANEDKYRSRIGDMTVLHWASTADDQTNNIVNLLAFFDESDKADAGEIDDMLSSVFEQIRRGEKPDFSAFGLDDCADYYVVGLLPNSSRLAVKFCYRNTLGEVMKNVLRYHGEFAHSKLNKAPSYARLGKELVSPKAKDQKLPPDFTGSMFDAMFTGVMYPRSLLERTVKRVKTDRAISDIKVGMIKAYLNRKNKSEVIKMSLDKDNKSSAYLSGRLFAVLEALQKDAAGGKLNRTIKDAYFASACSTPARVFPTLVKLAQSHLKKTDRAPRYEKMIGEIVTKLDNSFPKTLPLEKQGEFIVGYYQQQNDEIYAKKGKEEE